MHQAIIAIIKLCQRTDWALWFMIFGDRNKFLRMHLQSNNWSCQLARTHWNSISEVSYKLL